jgi:hypothetical protein
MKKYIRSVVLICALNGVGVWAEDQCAFKIISPEFGDWPSRSTMTEPQYLEINGLPLSITIRANKCILYRSYQTCAGPYDGAIGFTGYYCYNGPKRHHMERTDGKEGAPAEPCPHTGRVIVKSHFGPTKVLSKNPCTYYNR